MTAGGGAAKAEIVTDGILGNTVKISTTEAGELDYSVQFVQANIPVKQEGTYKLTFDAYAQEARTMIANVSAPDYSFARYMADTTVNLTNSKKNYEYEFTVKAHDDANARLEFNLGNTNPISDVYISNVKIEKVGQGTVDTSKKVLADGNFIANGKFQEGTEAGKKYMQDWAVTGAEASVTSLEDGRRIKLVPNATADKVELKQTALPLVAGKYALSFDVQNEGSESGTAKVTVAGSENTFNVSTVSENRSIKLELSEKDLQNKEISFDFTGCGTVYLDNVRLVEDTLIKNGSFNAGEAGYEFWYENKEADASWGVDSLTEKNIAAEVTVKNTGKADYHIQLKQNNVGLENGKWYKLEFKARTTLAGGRKIRAIMQGGESKGWAVYSGENIVDLTNEYQTFSKTFQMTQKSDPEAFLSICFGAVEQQVIDTEHKVCIDDIVLEEIEAPEQPSGEWGENMLKNAELSSDENWSKNIVSGNSAVIKDGTATFVINDIGQNSYDNEFSQNELTFKQGHSYKISFDITSTKSRDVCMKVQHDGNVDENLGSRLQRRCDFFE